jgi:hypothetical protein
MANIDLRNPGVRRLLGDADHESRLASGKPEKKLVHLAGDEDHGLSSALHLDTGKIEVLVYYKKTESWLTVDVYALPGERPHVILICPRCQHALTIKGERKTIEFDPAARRPIPDSIVPPELRHLSIGQLSIEPFECTWELDDKAKVTRDAGMVQLCRMKLAIDDNIARDA